jgi:serine/threonine protein kinase
VSNADIDSQSHPNIVRLYGWFHDANRIFLMMEFAGESSLILVCQPNQQDVP